MAVATTGGLIIPWFYSKQCSYHTNNGGKPPSFKAPVSSLKQQIKNNNNGGNSLICRCNNGTSSQNAAQESDWSSWQRHFSQIDQDENYSSLLKFQLEEAVENEDFYEASQVKKALEEVASKDVVAEVMSQLEKSIMEERYHDASLICRTTGSGLVGWWVGWSEGFDDPLGKIVQITPAVGRFVARSFSPRQLTTVSSGTPLFEIFVVKDAIEGYKMQAVYLQPPKGSSSQSTSSSLKSSDVASTPDSQKLSEEDKMNEFSSEKVDGKQNDIKDVTEEGLRSFINFLKDRIPSLKVKVLTNISPVDVKKGINLVEQLQGDDGNGDSVESSDDDDGSSSDFQDEEVLAGGDGDLGSDGKDMNVKLVIGGVLQTDEESSSKAPTRVPAQIKDIERDSFVLCIPGNGESGAGWGKASKLELAQIAAQAASELMPPDVAKAFLRMDKAFPKVSRNLREIVKYAIVQAQRRNILSPTTMFHRIKNGNESTDPLDGLYVGAFGPFESEVVQLRCKVGPWPRLDENDESFSNFEFCQYVEAVKLTGDLNVPAGQVTFLAKVGQENRLVNNGSYPEELGVVMRYKGRGRIAEPGFQNPRWVDGELLLFNGKGMGPLSGAELGFLYAVPKQSLLVLFDRLILPE
ncbi:hypothetical protein AMTR_s00058p00181770 [Amborella trichopoda]|uniref:Uncharacterized protein n=2 Tax=Amborella trichopoda TaxID=13333 RepID=W1PHQ9_AMBTC|nr:hypothetical protein AMTR_s00058p00181770 [Amborella trichopoda]